ncbi:uncharacterized protein LOC113210910 [Frankliniella occidentalis]|uniref:Uncharacterized protein LOC113210910 n=1 Tax=Frankliniella occidentalis TaxID=133901 RepID=A0A9C6X7L2_FRAOC|nr:uncharacterized protein LOC113210910 [Frankliniella occidentalis]
MKVVMSPRCLKLACVRMVAVHGRTFELMNDAAFQDIVKSYLNGFPARERYVRLFYKNTRTVASINKVSNQCTLFSMQLTDDWFAINDASIRTMVQEEATRLRTYIKNEVRGKMVSLKVDSSKKNGRPFFGVNIQFASNGEIQLRTLAVRELMVTQSAQNLKQEIMDILDMHDIVVTNIISFTSDNGQNILRAADLLRTNQEERQDLIDEDQEELDLFIEQEGVRLDSLKCAAHTLQLAVMEDSVRKIDSVTNLIKKCREIVKTCRTETNRKKLKRARLPIPVHDNDTRWNTSFAMLESLLKVKSFMEDDISDNFSEDDWTYVESVLESLEATMVVATKVLQAEQLTLGYMYGAWAECKIKLGKVGSPLASQILESMEKRERREVYALSNRLMAGQDKVPPLFDYPGFLAAIFLDLRYFAILEESDVVTAKSYISNLWTKIEKNKNPRHENIPEGDQVVEEEEEDEDEVSALLRARDRGRTRNFTSTHRDIFSMYV